MATTFQPQYTKRVRGRKVRRHTRCYYARWRDPATGRLVTRPTQTPDPVAAEQLASRWERDAHRRHAGLAVPEDDPRTAALHVADYLADLRARGRCPRRVRNAGIQLTKMVQGLGWRTLADLDGTELGRWLAERRAGPRFGAVTSNCYLATARAFARWLRLRGRLSGEPFAGLERVGEAADLRHERRALAAAEFARLVAAARARPALRGSLRGWRRACLYVVAAYTGLRASELASLTPESFDFGAVPTVTVEAAHSKHRQRDVLPLHPAALAAAREVLAATAPGDKLWPGRWPKHGAKGLRSDLRAAGLPYRDGRGRVFDFHALRGQHITALARAGVSVQAAQRLARHSDPRLTLNVYTRLEAEDLAAELAKVPA